MGGPSERLFMQLALAAPAIETWKSEDLRYFKVEDFACRCCGLNNTSPDLMRIVDDIRERVGRPLHVTSATRCVSHNKKEGGAPGSAHLEGLAVDIYTPSNREQFQVIRAIMKQGVIERIGTYYDKECVHIDLVKNRRNPSFWSV